MTTVSLTPANDEEWLSWRQHDITSTETSALFGMSPYETNFELWHRKKNAESPTFYDNERMMAGRHIEPAIASLAVELYGCSLKPMKWYSRDPDLRMGASHDYICEDGSVFGFPGQPGIVECKNVDGLIFRRKWHDDETPAHIEIQLQHQIELANVEWGAVMALVGGNRLVPYVRARDAAVGAAIRSRIAKFWRSIEANEPPPPVMPDDADAVIALNQFSDGSVFDARGTELESLLADFDIANAAESAAETRKKIIKAQVLQHVGAAGQIVWAGGKIALTQVADNPGKPITEAMIGEIIGARKGYRNFRSYPSKAKAEEAIKK